MNWEKIALAAIGLGGGGFLGVAFKTLFDNRAHRAIFASDAAQGTANALSTTITGAAGKLLTQMSRQLQRQEARILKMEVKLDERETEIEALKHENEGLHQENVELQGAVSRLEERISGLEASA